MRRDSLFWGLILVLIGILFLIDNLDIFDVDFWNLLWPLLIIVLGLWVLWSATLGRPEVTVEEAVIPLEGATRARVRVRHGAGRLRIYAGTEPDQLLAGTFGGGLEYQSRRTGDELDVRMRVRHISWSFRPFPWLVGTQSARDWSFGLNSQIPLALELETGAGESRLDLSDLQVTELRIQTGANSTDLLLPAHAGQTRARIDAGVASATIRVPPDVAARIRAEGGLTSVDVDQQRFPRSGRTYVSPDYETAVNKIDLDVQTGVGSIRIY
jgi:hypothetical protein